MTARDDLKKLAAGFFPARSIDVVDFLKHLYTNLKNSDEGYSYRQFSEDLGFGFTNYLHLVVQRRRMLTQKAAQKICEALELRGVVKQQFLAMVRYGRARLNRERDEALQALVDLKARTLQSALDRAQLTYFSAWYHPVVREMVTLPQFDQSPQWIAKHIFPPISVEEARESLTLLEKIGYIRWDDTDARYVTTTEHIRTPAEVLGLGVIKYHHEMLDRARASIATVKPAERDISAVTITLDESLIPEVKLELQNFRKRMLDKSSESKNPSRVYQMNFQFFPMTKEDEK